MIGTGRQRGKKSEIDTESPADCRNRFPSEKQGLMRINTKAITISDISRKFKRQEATLLSCDLPSRFPYTHFESACVGRQTHTDIHTLTHTHAISGSTIL